MQVTYYKMIKLTTRITILTKQQKYKLLTAIYKSTDMM